MVSHVITENVIGMDTTLGSKEEEPLTAGLVDGYEIQTNAFLAQ